MDVIQVGDIAVKRVIEDPRTLFDTHWFFPDATPEHVAAEIPWMAPRFYDLETETLVLCVQSFVFRAGGRNILVDTCVGNGKEGRRRESWNHGNFPYLENLAAAGFRPEDIDVVLCTHLHVDHAGWNTRLENGRWVPTFPNAEYLIAGEELKSIERRRAKGETQYVALYDDSVLPVLDSGQAVTVSVDHRVADGVALEPTPGHTPGHVAVRIRSGGDSAAAVGDMLHHPIQALYPDWSSRACEDMAQAAKTRRNFMAAAAGDGSWLLPAHFDPCRVAAQGPAFRFLFDA